MSVAGMMTPLSTGSFTRLQLNAGAFLVGFDWTSYSDATALRAAALTALASPATTLGVTRGGGTFVVNQEMRQAEVDGVRYHFVGDTFVDSVDAQLTTTLIEATPGNFKRILGSADVNASGKKSTLTMRTRIANSDYIDNLCWIGDLADGGLILIGFSHALNTAGMNLTFTDKGEATMPVEFHAFQGSVEDYDYAPFEVIFFDAVETPGVAIAPKYATLVVNDTLTLTTTKVPNTGSVTYASDDTDIASVTSGGVITANAAGTVTVTASMTVGTETVTDYMTVRVVTAS